MNQNEVNKIITEKVLRECWLNITQVPILIDDDGTVLDSMPSTPDTNPDFSQWSNYGPLLEKIQGEEWWEEFVAVQWANGLMPEGNFLGNLLRPTRGSLALAEFVVAHNR